MKKRASKSVPQQIRAELAALSAMPDDEIDTHDVPSTVDWSGAQRGRFYRPIKRQLTLRLDGDVVEWFKHYVRRRHGYQTQINSALRHYVRVVEGAAELKLKGWHSSFDQVALRDFMRHGGLSVAEANKFAGKIVGGRTTVTVVLRRIRDPLAAAEQFSAIGVKEVAIVLRPGSRGSSTVQH
ncbi:MAG: BrnA antitoxin family protein [Stellaceae bacterium]